MPQPTRDGCYDRYAPCPHRADCNCWMLTEPDTFGGTLEYRQALYVRAFDDFATGVAEDG